MHAMSVDYHFRKSLEYGFSEVSDKVRDQLMSKGVDNRTASIHAPLMVEGIRQALSGELDFRKIHYALRDDAVGDTGWDLVPA
jgi:hypothetical protein